GTAELHVHIDGFAKGARVLVVDDLLATGGTLRAGCQLVEKAGAKVVGCAVLVELLFLKGRDKLKPFEVFSVIQFLVLSRSTCMIDCAKSGGLVPAIAQDAQSGDVLMLAWMNQQAYEETLRTGRAVYFSRSRNKLWRKGEESGNVQEVREIFVDCDADTILLKVEQVGGAACHEGYQSCFFRKLDKKGAVSETIGERLFDPAKVYRK